MPRAVTTSVLVIDHNPILLEGLACLIRTEPDMMLAGTASNLQDGLAFAAKEHADCILIDLDLCSTPDFEILCSLRKADPTAMLIGLITYELDDRVSGALKAGAAAVLAKDQIPNKLTALIRMTCRLHSS